MGRDTQFLEQLVPQLETQLVPQLEAQLPPLQLFDEQFETAFVSEAPPSTFSKSERFNCSSRDSSNDLATVSFCFMFLCIFRCKYK
jgi:hypothetical protein